MKALNLITVIVLMIAGLALTVLIVDYFTYDDTHHSDTKNKTYRLASRIHSNVKFIANVKADLIDAYNVGDTVWVSLIADAPRVCDECTWSHNLVDDEHFIKAIIRD